MTRDALAILESVKTGQCVLWEDFIAAAEQRHDELLAEVTWHEGQGERSKEIRLIRCDDVATV